MRLFAGSADPSAIKVMSRPGVRRLADHLRSLSLPKLTFHHRPRGRIAGVLFTLMAAMAGGLAGWLGPLELAILLVLTFHLGIAYLLAGAPQHTGALAPPQRISTEQETGTQNAPSDAPRQHRLLRLAARAIEQGQLTEAALIYQRAIRECPADSDVQTIARHSLENLDLSEKIVKNAQA
ncbi:MAG: hypothetical protein H6905_03490 [Hyphomicrobiales bacterium]|nr:hypothetical protein [Hyphomicrobiales bacterium]